MKPRIPLPALPFSRADLFGLLAVVYNPVSEAGPGIHGGRTLQLHP